MVTSSTTTGILIFEFLCILLLGSPIMIYININEAIKRNKLQEDDV
jgi:hypothetical protein